MNIQEEQGHGGPKGFKSGFVSIVGRPNAGKSTLLNALVGEKVSIVSARPQTTRNAIKGVKTGAQFQIVFIDTPGLHAKKGPLHDFMRSEALSALKGVDAIVYLVDAEKPVDADVEFLLTGLKASKTPCVLGINKVDAIKKEELLPMIKKLSSVREFAGVVPLSALKGDGVDVLIEVLLPIMPEGPKYFPDDMSTDQPERFIVAEMVREKVFRFTRDEVPYSTAVVVERFKDRGELISISATIIVERESQKGIIIGKNGAMLKKIGTSARLDIEALLGVKVYLELFVKVRGSWTTSAQDVEGLKYDR